MKHLSPEELVLYYYGEREDAAGHINSCEVCRREYQAVQRTLNAVDSLPVPERPEDYASIVWRRISPQLPARPRRSFWFSAPKWAMAAMLLIGAFFLGRVVPRPAAPANTSNPERILLVAVGDHLERSQMILAEIANSADPGKGMLDISYEQKLATDLVETNRLYRVSADSNGDRATSALLDDLERVLMEIAHSPAKVSGAQYEDLKREIDDHGLLFKVRIYQKKIEERDKTI